MATLNELAKQAYENAKAKGFYENPVDNGTRIALMHAELSEALEELRKGHSVGTLYYDGKKPEGPAVELIDCMIRILDLLGKEDVDVDGLIRLKMDYNASRPHLHGGKKF